jgi:glutamate-5-semialdehyde dehydrogenase
MPNTVSTEAVSTGAVNGPAAPVDDVRSAAARAKAAAPALRSLTRARKDEGLRAIAAALRLRSAEIVAVNADDVAAARRSGTSAGLVDRLLLDAGRIAAIADAVAEVAELPDPVGEVVRGSTLPNGLQVRQVRVPMGVVGIIYEARPNVTVDGAALCLKSGNAVLLRGSSSAFRTNSILVAVMRDALSSCGLPADAVTLVPGTGHDAVQELITARGLVDVIIPRGGAALIEAVVTGATVPVIETGVGNCHVYVDAAADVPMAVAIVVNAKTQRVSVCNAAETLLVHRDVAERFFAAAAPVLAERGVTLHADDAVSGLVAGTGVEVQPATPEDWAAEYYSLDLAAAVVESVDAAAEHIRRWSSGHTEAIVSDSAAAISSFIAGVDSAAIMVNASTRFTDGGEFGFGAEIGISTQKLHARGPMALPELTTTTYIVTGSGQIRS